MINLEQLSIGDKIDNAVFLISDVSTKSVRSGDLVTNFTFQNKTGRIPGILWGKPKATFQPSDVVCVSGTIGYFNGHQVQVSTIERVASQAILPFMEDLMPSSEIPIDILKGRVHDMIWSCIYDAGLQRLLAVLIDYDGIYHKEFFKAPAAKRLHHAWIGGLAEHSLSVAHIVSMVSPLYPTINVDIAIAGALLHDIGKIKELSIEKGFAYSDIGRLQSHIYIGAQIVSDCMELHGKVVDEAISQDLIHIILSHHRELEFGALVKPATLEAELVALADFMDSQIVGAQDMIKADNTPGNWTGFDAISKRVMRKNIPVTVSIPESDVEVEDGGFPDGLRSRI